MKKRGERDVSLILTGFNEGRALRKNLRLVKEVLDSTRYSWEIILIDDQSHDGTARVFSDFAEKNRGVRAFFHEKNVGRGGTVMEGMRNAKGRVVGYLDTDLEILPVHIAEFIRAVDKGADVVIARRHYNLTTSVFLRMVLSQGYVFIMRKWLGLGFRDTEAGCKFFNRRRILPVLESVKDKRWFFDTEVVVRSFYEGLRVVELPVVYVWNPDKESSVNVLRDIWCYLGQLWRFKGTMKKEGKFGRKEGDESTS